VTLLEIGVKKNAIVTVDGAAKARSRYGERVNIFNEPVCPACASEIRAFELATRRVFVCEACQPL
jgi:endonuclease-8